MADNQDKILVIDDEEIIIEVIEKHLKKDGYEMYSAGNGKEGLKQLSQTNPIVIILDLRMPVMDGFEFLEKLELSPTDPYAVIVLTGHGGDEDMEKCFDLGVSSFLRKPFNIFELRGVVRNSIKFKKTQQHLQDEVIERKNVEEKLRDYKDHLEVLVQERTAELKKTNLELKNSLNEKEVLIKEIHHRVKNNLQIVSSLLDLQSKSVDDSKTLYMFKDSQSRVKTMALIHEKLYQSDDLSRIDIAKYITNLSEYLFRSYGVNSSRILLKTSIDKVSLNVDTAVPCGLIINELVSNSLKHSFPDERSGEIKIELHMYKEGEYELLVSDNGVGMPEEMDVQNTEKLGLRLVKTLSLDQLEGSLDFKSDRGVMFKIKFREIKYKKRGV